MVDLPDVRAKLREYEASLGLNLSFQAFAREIADLPGDYVLPLLLARFRADIVGMVAIPSPSRDVKTADMKRLYVRQVARGTGVGRALVERVIAVARNSGCCAIVLDTFRAMASARRFPEGAERREL